MLPDVRTNTYTTVVYVELTKIKAWGMFPHD